MFKCQSHRKISMQTNNNNKKKAKHSGWQVRQTEFHTLHTTTTRVLQ